METKFNFNSAICTDRLQSERLLALGLKKETADMSHRYSNIGGNYEESVFPYSSILALKERMNKPILGRGWEELYGRDIPAWSLHRLWDILPKDVEVDDDCYITSHLEGEKAIVYHDYGSHYYNFDKNNIYDNIVNCIEWLIKEGYFPKEYLV